MVYRKFPRAGSRGPNFNHSDHLAIGTDLASIPVSRNRISKFNHLMNRTLVIGYGNSLRRDDAAGVYAAERIRSEYPGVECVTAQKLSPEMAITLAHFKRVIFIDASDAALDLNVRTLYPGARVKTPEANALTPQMLLDASHEIYGQVPRQTLQIEIPASDFTSGESLSPKARLLVDQCVEIVRSLFSSDSPRPNPSGTARSV
jgi:hydrogenase maturation protease